MAETNIGLEQLIQWVSKEAAEEITYVSEFEKEMVSGGLFDARLVDRAKERAGVLLCIENALVDLQRRLDEIGFPDGVDDW